MDDFKTSDLFKGLPPSTTSCWCDLTDITTLFQDREGKIPVTEYGQTIRMVFDKSGNGNHMYGEFIYER